MTTNANLGQIRAAIADHLETSNLLASVDDLCVRLTDVILAIPDDEPTDDEEA